MHPEFPPLQVDGDFDKRQLDPEFVATREKEVTAGYQRLLEVAEKQIPITEMRVG